jgi:hypothetical protein
MEGLYPAIRVTLHGLSSRPSLFFAGAVGRIINPFGNYGSSFVDEDDASGNPVLSRIGSRVASRIGDDLDVETSI